MSEYCLIGEKLSHSLSKDLHARLGLSYELVELPRGKVGEFFKKCPYKGFNVTIPYKKEVVSYLSGLSDAARKTGAVNTVVKTENGFFGHNTDAFGMEYMLFRAGIEINGKNLMILGGGGTAATATFVAEKLGAKSVVKVERKGEINYTNCYDLGGTQVIINCTPVGMFPRSEEIPIDLERFPVLEAVADCVYNPLKTRLVLKGEELGVKATGGLSMLVAQGVEAERIWTGKTFDNGLIERLIKEEEEILK